MIEMKTIIIYLQNLPIVYHWNDRAINLNVELCILYADPDPDSHPIAKAPVLYVYVIPLFVSAEMYEISEILPIARERTI